MGEVSGGAGQTGRRVGRAKSFSMAEELQAAANPWGFSNVFGIETNVEPSFLLDNGNDL